MASMSKNAFGSKANIESAKAAGTIDQYDVLYLDTQEIGWIDKNGDTVISTTRTQAPIEVNGVTGLGIGNGETIPAGTSVDDIVKMLVQKAVPATYTKPTVSLGNYGGQASGNVEAGTSITPKLRATFTQNDAGDLSAISIMKGTTEVANGASTPLDYTGDAIVIGDETITFTASATYGDAPVKNNNLGQESKENWFAGDTVSSSAYNIVGKRRTFYGCGVSTIDTPTSDIIRNMNNSKLNVVAGNTFTMTVETGCQHILFALPSPRTLKQISYDDLGDKGMLTSFTKFTVKVADARGGENGLVDYNCYIYNLQTPSAAPMTFTFTVD